MTGTEIVFWILTASYVFNEVQQMFIYGMAIYTKQTQNYYDMILAVLFIAIISLRIHGSLTKTDSNATNNTFIILLSISTITLWLRVLDFFIVFSKLGPMVQKIYAMMDDIMTFFKIMFVIYLGFTFALCFVMGSVHEDFSDPVEAAVTLFRAMLGDFDFSAFQEDTDIVLLFFGYAVMFVYLIIGSIVLLNLLIAMMSKTFDAIEETQQIKMRISIFNIARTLDSNPAFIPPPLNIFAMTLSVIFYGIEWIIRVCSCCKKEKFDLIAVIMPSFMRKRKLELDEQILWENCKRYWEITTDRGLTKCKAIKF
eukprot:511984_1